MRSKKNREVNIFSASVVDLFASGLGVFLIVAIIALVNQKKENSKGKIEDQLAQVHSMEGSENTELKAKFQALKKENFDLQIKNAELKATQEKNGTNEDRKKLEFEMAKSEFTRSEVVKNQKIRELQLKLEESERKINKLKGTIASLSNSHESDETDKKNKFHSYEIGSKFKLENVHFYPGTDRAIEPYASQEIRSVADFLQKNSTFIVEVSGHIFETKKRILAKQAIDEYNLSGRRAEFVCNKLIEFGIEGKRLRCIGYGAKRYIHLTNDQYSPEAQLNRRVEVEILSN